MRVGHGDAVTLIMFRAVRVSLSLHCASVHFVTGETVTELGKESLKCSKVSLNFQGCPEMLPSTVLQRPFNVLHLRPCPWFTGSVFLFAGEMLSCWQMCAQAVFIGDERGEHAGLVAFANAEVFSRSHRKSVICSGFASLIRVFGALWQRSCGS